MSEQTHRFECILEPTNKWMVWDKTRGLPAEFSAITLVGLRRREAASLCWLLNESAGTETQKSQAG
jgi:hypothetical protein